MERRRHDRPLPPALAGAAHGLESGKFICVVPRHRLNPAGAPTRQGDARDTYNALYLEEDCPKLRAATAAYVRAAGNQVALAPGLPEGHVPRFSVGG